MRFKRISINAPTFSSLVCHTEFSMSINFPENPALQSLFIRFDDWSHDRKSGLFMFISVSSPPHENSFYYYVSI